MIKPLDALPEKWCLQITKDNIDFINKHRVTKILRAPIKGGFAGSFISSDPVSSLNWGWIYISKPLDYKEITLEDFKKHVLKLSDFPMKWKIIDCEEVTNWLSETLNTPLGRVIKDHYLIFYSNNIDDLKTKDDFDIIGKNDKEGENYREVTIEQWKKHFVIKEEDYSYLIKFINKIRANEC